ncbi:MAG TPA: hypothetical protein VFV96_09740 [Verrucomicrobiae bacterium]|nr:hypothetical protein [Verrucomicrobiae bacterium]
MKKLVALMALVAFTFAVQAGAGADKSTDAKKSCDKAKTEGCCPAKSGKCPAGGDKAKTADKKS